MAGKGQAQLGRQGCDDRQRPVEQQGNCRQSDEVE